MASEGVEPAKPVRVRSALGCQLCAVSAYFGLIGFFWLAIADPAVGAGEDFRLYSISHAPNQFNPDIGERVAVSFETREAAVVQLEIYDELDRRVALIGDRALLQPGTHALAWDGRDLDGNRVPPEAYRYVLIAKSERSDQVFRHDPAQARDDFESDWLDASWSRDTKTVDYRLEKPSRVRIRIGLRNDGPLLRTVVNWAPRDQGDQSESWDGMDESGVVNLSRHPNLAASVVAFALPMNTVLVGPPAAKPVFLEQSAELSNRTNTPDGAEFQMFDYANQRPERRRDFPVELILAGSAISGAPTSQAEVVTGKQRIEISMSDRDLSMLMDEGFEAVFFIDGRREFEAEVAFFPIVWDLDTANLTEGEHLLTVNLRGFEGHFGIASRAIQVERTDAAKE